MLDPWIIEEIRRREEEQRQREERQPLVLELPLGPGPSGDPAGGGWDEPDRERRPVPLHDDPPRGIVIIEF